jgi:hypothetical protein
MVVETQQFAVLTAMKKSKWNIKIWRGSISPS